MYLYKLKIEKNKYFKLKQRLNSIEKKWEDLLINQNPDINKINKLIKQYEQVTDLLENSKEQIIYWYKNNITYNYFIRLDKKAYDEEEIYVTKRDLEKLYKLTINCIIEYYKGNIEYCKKHLPSLDGFGFGSIKYNDDYLYMLEDTKKQLEQHVLRNNHNDYIFVASY